MLIRAVFITILLAATLFAQQPQTGQLDSNPALFTILAALNAVGYAADLDSPANHPLRKAVREYVTKRNPPSLEQLRVFFREHKKANASQELSQYVSLALCLTAPPELELAHPDRQLPPDAEPLAGGIPLFRKFYQEADIENVWKQVQPAIDQVLDRYQAPVSRAVTEASGYLRVPLGTAFLGRKFQIYVDLLGAPHQIHTRSYGDDEFIVLTSTFEPPIDEIRRAYIQYLVDPLVVKYSEAVNKKRGLIDYAQGSPILDQHYKDDFVLLTTACLVRAVESRISPAAQRKVMVDQALREGFVVTPALTELLVAYEKDERAMRLYLPDLIDSIDLKHEAKRLDNVQFASERPVRMIKAPPSATKPETILAGAAKTYEDAEKLYKDRNLPAARDAYLGVLQQTADQSLHARAYYGLARIAALSKDPELADKLFTKVLALGPDSETLAWSLLYLARLAENRTDGTSDAEKYYRAALAIADAPETVRKAAVTFLAGKPRPQ